MNNYIALADSMPDNFKLPSEMTREELIDDETNLCHECHENEATFRDFCPSCNLKIFGNA
jgi:lipopolysaccharide biosynthesis regulator YciM